jgi:hypothetical protein
MDLDGRLTLVLRDCAWAVDPSVALRLVPELGQDCPPLSEVPVGDGSSVLGIAWGGETELVPAVAELVERLLARALQNQAREDFVVQRRADLVKDPLVGPLCRIIAQTAVPAFHVRVLPVLAIARTVARALRAPKELAGLARADVVDRLVGHVEQLGRTPVGRRAEILTQITAGIGARATAAFAEVHGARVRPSGLFRRILADPLALCLGKGTLDRDPDLVLVAMSAALPISPSSLQHVRDAAAIAFQALQERRGKGKPLVIDEMLGHAVRDLRSFPSAPDRLLFHPTAGPLLVGALPDLVDARSLEKEGLPKDLAKMLTRVDGVQGLAASWGDLVDALLVWDVLSTLVSKIVPLTWTHGHLRGPQGNIPHHPRWSMIVPRGAHAPSEAAVVAVRLTEVIEHLRKSETLVPPSHVVERAWSVATENLAGTLSETHAEHGIVVFGDATEALHFASAYLSELAMNGLDRGDGQRVQLPDHVQASAGVAWGPVTGGTDGHAVVLGGSAVARAVALAGSASPAGVATRDPLGMSRVVAGAKGLESRGTVCDGWIVKKALEAVRGRQVAIHTQGSRVDVAGVALDFSRVPITAWWLEGDWVSCFYPLDPADPGGASEHIQLSRAQFRRFFHDDQNASHPTGAEGGSALVGVGQLGRRSEAPAEASPTDGPDLRLPAVSFGLDVPEAADGEGGYAADLWGPEEDTPVTFARADTPAEVVADAISYDGPFVSIEEADDPRTRDIVPDKAAPAEWLEELPSDAIVEPIREAAFGGATVTVRLPERKEPRIPESWEELTDPNIRPYDLGADVDESEPTDERKPLLTRAVPPPLPLLDDPAKTPTVAPNAADVGSMLVGYVCLRGNDGFTFGRIYGNRLVDVHVYATADRSDAYGRFLADKVAEQFVLRMERTSFLPEDVKIEAVDLHLLNQTWRAMVSP